ncbi:roadblock/LC7 domain-containing protein [Streptomyces sp. NPDC059373]
MTNDTTANDTGLGWLLEDFVRRVPGTDSAVLASRDGLKLSFAGVTADQADKTAALMSGLHSLSRGVGEITDSRDGNVRQVVIEHDAAFMFVMSIDGLPEKTLRELGADPRTASTLLGVLAGPKADAGMVGYEMATLLKSVAEHLVIPTRHSDAPFGDGQ